MHCAEVGIPCKNGISSSGLSTSISSNEMGTFHEDESTGLPKAD